MNYQGDIVDEEQRPLVPAQRDAAQQVRMHVINDLRRNQANSKLALCWSTTLYLPQIIAALVVLLSYWSPVAASSCTNFFELRLWSAVHAGRLAIGLLLHCGSFCEPRGRDRVVKTFVVINRMLTYFGFFWLFAGLWIVFIRNNNDCQPQIYALAKWLVLINVIIFMLPCLVFLCAIPIVCLCLPCLIRFVAYLQQPDPHRREAEIRGLTESAYRRQEGAEPEDCPICMQTFENGQMIRSLPCHSKHFFHSECIDTWLRVHDSCPICRMRLFTPANGYEDQFGMNDEFAFA